MGDKPARGPLKHQPTHDYEDHELFGVRVSVNSIIDQLRAGNDSECVVVNIGTAESKEQTSLKDITGQNKHLLSMVRASNIQHLFPIQRYSWSKLNRCRFPNLIISPQGTGKTYTHILYALSKCTLSSDSFTIRQKLDGTIRDDVLLLPDDIDLKRHAAHPKYIVICSSQENVEYIIRIIEESKRGAYHLTMDDYRTRSMPPVAKSIGLQHDETKLSYRCQQSDILVATPLSLMKCLKAGYIHFAKCHKIFFDDLDVLLQVQNNNLRELMKIYIVHSDQEASIDGSSRVHFFSRKWTDLVRQFMTSLFPQRVILFGSIAEASVYYNMKFDVELYNDDREKLNSLSSLINTYRAAFPDQKLCIVTSTDEEATHMGRQLIDKNHAVKVVCDGGINGFGQTSVNAKSRRTLIFVTSDPALEFLVEVSNRRQRLDDIDHIIHATLPDDVLAFDQRFRLAFRHIRDEKNGLATTILLGPDIKMKLAKNVYDLMSRSVKTQTASKLTMRDYIIAHSPATQICWRWATMGLCRLEKLSRDDRFGSYCFDRHSLLSDVSNTDLSHPETGQVGITITHVLSPSEFYFRFESRRGFEDGKWVKVRGPGNENMQKLQVLLDSLKSVNLGSVPLDDIRQGKVFAVHFPELSRVDRVRLLDKTKHESPPESVNVNLEYSKLIPVIKIDYGIRVHVKIRNLIALPKEVEQFPAQALRGLHLGYKPTDNEPNWLCQSKERFFILVTENGPCKASAWLRLNRDGCFWFENLTISRQLSNIDSCQVSSVEPHRQLLREGLAELALAQPSFLSPSRRLVTLCKWNHDRLKEFVAYAYIENLFRPQKIFLIDISTQFTISFRHEKFDKQLKEIELKIYRDFIDGKLLRLNYFEPDVYCIARVTLPNGKEHWNRAKIFEVIEHNQDIESHEDMPEPEMRINCLDYGDFMFVKRSNLYQASPDHIRALPFQAIFRKMANVHSGLLEGADSGRRAREIILSTIDDDTPILCEMDENNNLYLYAPQGHPFMFEPLSRLLENHDLRLHQEAKPQYERMISTKQDIEDSNGLVVDEEPRPLSDYEEGKLNEQIIKLLRELAKVELGKFRMSNPGATREI